ncbi:hypothetical protein Tco_0779168 [Tanacetum coccineum]
MFNHDSALGYLVVVLNDHLLPPAFFFSPAATVRALAQSRKKFEGEVLGRGAISRAAIIQEWHARKWAIDARSYISGKSTQNPDDEPIAELASHKDASMSDLMDLLHLEGVETSLSFSLDVIHARVQRIRGDAAARRLSLSDAMVPLIEPLSAENLTGEASTFRVPTTVTTTALSTNFIQNSSVPLISVADYEVSGAEYPTKFPSPLNCVEKESCRLLYEHTTG